MYLFIYYTPESIWDDFFKTFEFHLLLDIYFSFKIVEKNDEIMLTGNIIFIIFAIVA